MAISPKATSAIPAVSPRDDGRRPAYVYRIYDADGLIYIGSTVNLWQRLSQHHSTAWWAQTVVKVRAELRPDEITARRDEKAAILAEKPRHNLQERGRQLYSLPEDEFREYVYAWVRHVAWTCRRPFRSAPAGGPTLDRIFLAYRQRFGKELDLDTLLPEAPRLA